MRIFIMEGEGGRSLSELNEKIFQNFSDFMTRVTQFQELVAVGRRFLVGFQQGMEFLRRPPITKTSELVERILEANETERVLSYVKAGCINNHDSLQNIRKLHTCQIGLWDQLSKAKCILKELECLVEDATGAMQAANDSFPDLWDNDNRDELDLQATAYDKEEMVSFDLQKPGATDYAILMCIIYSMVKQDYMMQERVVSSLNLKSSSGELETYCLMWSLRPFINDEIMHQAWRLIP